jgi:hypothetical protein
MNKSSWNVKLCLTYLPRFILKYSVIRGRNVDTKYTAGNYYYHYYYYYKYYWEKAARTT